MVYVDLGVIPFGCFCNRVDYPINRMMRDESLKENAANIHRPAWLSDKGAYEMNKRSIIEIAIRIYALYLITQVPMVLWGIVPVFAMDTSNFVTNPGLYRIWAIVNPFLYLFISLILLIKAPFISNVIVGKQEEDTRGHESSLQQSHLSFWITLLGLYFLITYVFSMIAELVKIPIMAGDHYMWSIVVANGIVIGVAVVVHATYS
jgi:hypothetical protein